MTKKTKKKKTPGNKQTNKIPNSLANCRNGVNYLIAQPELS